jgi:peptidoglycan/LPS O-acetylase OafA/YrhL
MKYIKGLDSLRAFAVILVIINHWGPHKFQSVILTFIFTRILPDGAFGVDLFFVLSGYLITYILINAKEQAPATGRAAIIKTFYIRRALRIFPVYFLLIFVLYWLNDNDVNTHLWYFLTYTSNFLIFNAKHWTSFSHTWSLAVEEQFYLLWPWIIIFSPKRHLLTIIIVCFSLGLISSIILEAIYGEFFWILTLPCITAFAIGALYAYAQFDAVFNIKLKKIFLFLLPVAIVLFFINQFGYKLSSIRAANGIIAINIIGYVITGKYNRLTAAIFNNPFLIYTGKISYGIYLYHYVLPGNYLHFIACLGRQIHLSNRMVKILTYPPPAYIIQLILVFIIAWLSYILIETKVMKLKKYFDYVPEPSR